MPDAPIEIEAIRSIAAAVAWLWMLHSVWIGLAVGAVTILAMRAMARLEPSWRYRLVSVAMAAVVALPIVAAVVQRMACRATGAEPGSVIVSVGESRPGAMASNPLAESRPPSVARSFGFDLASVARAIRGWRVVTLAVWSAGATGWLAALTVGAMASRRLRREALAAPEDVAQRSNGLAQRLGLKASPEVLVHPTLAEPCLCGYVRPAVLLPEGWLREASSSAVSAVLAHELAHAARRDQFGNLGQRLLEALLFFHPTFLWLSRSLRRQREHRADAMAVRLTGDPMALARTLESFARVRSRPSTARGLVAAFAGEGPSLLLPRIQEILGMRPQIDRSRPWFLIALPVAGMLAVAVMQPVMAADEPKPSKAPVPVMVEFTPTPIPEGSKPTPIPEDTDGQISFEVQILELSENLQAGLADPDFRLHDPSSLRGWFLSELEENLLQQVGAGDPGFQKIAAPKVTAFEASEARLIFPLQRPGQNQNPVDDLEVRVRGTNQNGFVRLEVAMGHPDPVGDQPKLVEATATLPDGGTLALQFAELMSKPGAEAAQIVLITPRVILLEEEEERLGVPSANAQPEPR